MDSIVITDAPEQSKSHDSYFLAKSKQSSVSTEVLDTGEADHAHLENDLREISPLRDQKHSELRQETEDKATPTTMGEKQSPESVTNTEVIPNSSSIVKKSIITALEKSVHAEKERADAAEKNLAKAKGTLKVRRREKGKPKDELSMNSVTGQIDAALVGIRERMEGFGQCQGYNAVNLANSADSPEKLRREIIAKERDNQELRDSLHDAEERILIISRENLAQMEVVSELQKALRLAHEKGSEEAKTARYSLSGQKHESEGANEKASAQLLRSEEQAKILKNTVEQKDKEVAALRKFVDELEEKQKVMEEDLEEYQTKLKQTSQKATYFSFQANEYKERLENWLTEANEERTQLQHSLQGSAKQLKEREEIIVTLRKSLVDSLGLLKPLRHQVSFSEQDIRGLKRRISSMQLYTYSVLDALEKEKSKCQEQFEVMHVSGGASQGLTLSNENEAKQCEQILMLQEKLRGVQQRLDKAQLRLDRRSEVVATRGEGDGQNAIEELNVVKQNLRMLEVEHGSAQQAMGSLMKDRDFATQEKSDLEQQLDKAHLDISQLTLKLRKRNKGVDEIDLLQEVEAMGNTIRKLELEKEQILAELSLPPPRLLSPKPQYSESCQSSLSTHDDPCLDNHITEMEEAIDELQLHKEELLQVIADTQKAHENLLVEHKREINQMSLSKESLSKTIKKLKANLARIQQEEEERLSKNGIQLEEELREATKSIQGLEIKLNEMARQHDLMKEELASERQKFVSLEVINRPVPQGRHDKEQSELGSPRSVADKSVFASQHSQQRCAQQTLQVNSTFQSQLQQLEVRLYEVGCLYHVTKKKLKDEEKAKIIVQQELINVLQSTEGATEQVDQLTEALLLKESELQKAKYVATRAIVQMDEMKKKERKGGKIAVAGTTTATRRRE